MPISPPPGGSGPAIGSPPAVVYLNTAENATGTGVAVARSIQTGDTADLATAFNRNACNVDVLAAYAGPAAFCVLTGLTPSVPGSGLNLPIAAGQGAIGGLVELPSGGTIALPNTTNPVYVWLNQNATLSYTTTTTAPSTTSCLIALAETSGGNILAVSTAGVLFMKGGVLIRTTGDTGMPTDSPPAGVQFLNKCQGCSYWWTGTEYIRVWEPMSVNKDLIPAGEVMLIPANYQAYIYNRLIIEGRVIIEGRLRVEA